MADLRLLENGLQSFCFGPAPDVLLPQFGSLSSQFFIFCDQLFLALSWSLMLRSHRSSDSAILGIVQ